MRLLQLVYYLFALWCLPILKVACFILSAAATSDLPEAKVLFAGNKTFYFDVGSNRYGVFLRISELRSNYRTAVTIPEHHWPRFRDILSELADKIDDTKLSGDKPQQQTQQQQQKQQPQHQGQSGDDKPAKKEGDGVPEDATKGEKSTAGEKAAPAGAPIKAEPTAIPVA